MKKLKLFWTLLFVLAIFASCQGPKLSTKKLRNYQDYSEMIAEAKEIINEISVDDFNNNYFENSHIYLIDVRTVGEFEDGNIKGAVSIPRGVLEFRIGYDDFWREIETVPPVKEDLIVLYCRSGGRSVLATKTLMQLGYKNVHSLKGGWNAWVESNQ